MNRVDEKFLPDWLSRSVPVGSFEKPHARASLVPSSLALPQKSCVSWLSSVLLLALVMSLSACSTVLRTEARVEHAWPAQLANKTYELKVLQTVPAAAPAPVSANPAQLEQAQQALHAQLQRLGFTAVPSQANLLISLQYAEQSEAVYLVDEVLFAPHNRFWARGPWGRSQFGWGHTGYFGPWYSRSHPLLPRVPRYSMPFYGYAGPHWHPSAWLPTAFTTKNPNSQLPREFVYAPFFNGPIYVYRESSFPSTARHIKVTIEQNQKKLFEVWVDNTSRLAVDSALVSRVVPFMLESAFVEFPGVSGSTTIRELKLE